MAFPVSAENKATLERPAPDPCSFRIKSRAPVELHLSAVRADIRKTLSSSASFLGQTSCPYPVRSCLQSRARSRRACSPPPRFLPVGTFATAVNDRAGMHGGARARRTDHKRGFEYTIASRESGSRSHAIGSWGARLWTDVGAHQSNRPLWI